MLLNLANTPALSNPRAFLHGRGFFVSSDAAKYFAVGNITASPSVRFVAGFIGAALSIVLQLAATAGLLWLEGRYDWTTIYDNYLLFSLLIWFPEALLNGAALTLLAVYKPEWLRTFYDREYLSPDR